MVKFPAISDKDRKAARKTIGPLKGRQISIQAKDRYEAALAYFFWLVPFFTALWPEDWHQRDQILCQFIEGLWSEGEAKAKAADTISGLQWWYSTRRVFPGAWRLFGTWSKLEASVQTPPLPVEALFALCGHALREGQAFFAVALFLSFHCLLRTGEMVLLSISQFRGWGRELTLVLTDTKTTKRHGQTEYIIVDCPVAQTLLAWARLRLRHGPLVGGGEGHFRGLWRSLMEGIGLDPSVYTPYCIRRGGATFDFIDSGSLDRALVRGRWQQLKTARIYIRQGEELLARLRFSAAQRSEFKQLKTEFLAFVMRARGELTGGSS